MNLKKFLKAALCGAMVVAMAVTAGCGGGDKKADSGKKVLKVGMECAYAINITGHRKYQFAIA